MKFVVDVMLGRLARWLRLLGFDVVYQPNAQDEQLIALAEAEERTLLTKDARLLRDRRVNGYLVKSTRWEDQLREVVAEFHLSALIRAFTRCPECNTRLVEVDRESVRSRVPAKVYEQQQEFYRCPNCARLYWAGTHVERMSRKIEELLRG
ncbi:MAG: Mut7-C RNAse domain-containing protein [Blastocatellia bacterium]|nr:Mut7-C RNAse domain-containing protein [Blastocatellia bacterium]MCS7157711.1 Mut7-C RNAse domain-containing protein [Blastocatellia bacterium]MCX7751976.1 Mut7-C RNAse domain-containing protein [Blastocatellia bacterium]MDW8167082.1 Mut7-C RNAse domain-containing protein [Acidobacteriota bacterium]MDW8257186.1 Mut7-C RNAse domain-containing protein [Acidobacteriota bacterium]